MPRSPPDLTVPDPTPAQRIASAWREAADDAAAIRSLNARPLGIGWATVDLDRATAELAVDLGLLGPGVFRPARRSAVLGGACRVADGVLPDDGLLVVLEPDTEGRLAGSLARLGEGPLVAWLAGEATGPDLDPVDTAAPLAGAGLTLPSGGDGPLGLERLVLEGPVRGPGRYRLLVVRAAGTIQS
jgi:hypothetical protein